MTMFHRLSWFIFLIVILPVGIRANEQPSEESTAADRGKVAQLIKQLGHDRFVMREHAQAKLEELGSATFDALTEALEHDDLEIANRASFLLGKIRFNWTTARDSKRIRTLLKDYSSQDEAQRIRIIETLAEFGRDEDLGVLCRITRYDRSHRVSKRAALALMLLWSPTEEIAGRRTQLALEHFGDTQRTATQWYRAFVEARTDADDAIERLLSIANTEHGKSGTTHLQTGPDVVARLFYVVADLYAARENAELAQQNADRALAAGGNEAKHRLDFIPHLELRGHFDWAENEYRQIVKSTSGKSIQHRGALRLLSNMFHDQGRLEEAATVHKQLAEMTQRHRGSLGPFEPPLQETRAQMYYLYSLHYEKQGDLVKQAEALKQASSLTTLHPDIIISLYRLPNLSVVERKQMTIRIQGTVERFRILMRRVEDMKRMKETSRLTGQAHNQFAWLVGNTLGETDTKLADEAIDASHRSLELSPGSFAYTDTLARCYYARGKIEQAIKFQKQALALNPHSGLLQAQLEFFEKKLAKSKSKTK